MTNYHNNPYGTTMVRWMAVVAMVFLVACGGTEGTEGPGECGDDEFYDDAEEECVTCPAVVEPECRPECDVELVDDGQECPALQCETDCES